jgi:uncharacterized protein (DUF58 family)
MQETKEIIAQVRKIEISTKHLVDGLITGNYHSIFKGQGIEFSEIREYRAGDDTRSIDWKVTARFNHPYIKEFIEERDLAVYFAIDVSGSSSFGSNTSKKMKSIQIAASLMFAALRNNDKIGLFLFTDKIEKYAPERKGRRHVLKLISTLVSFEPKSQGTDIKNALVHVSKVAKKRGIVFIISDFYSRDFIAPLNILKNRHDIIALRIVDPREQEMPDVGLIELEDEESGEQMLVDTSDGNFRENFKKIMHEEDRKLKKTMRRAKIDVINIRTDEPYEVPLRKFFGTRKRRTVR